MLEAFSTAENRGRTLILLAICGLLSAGAAAVSIDDNALGVALAFLSAVAAVLAFVHPWRTVAQFRRLITLAGLGFGVLVLLSNLFEALAPKAGVASPLGTLFGGAGALCFVIALLLCLPGVVAGVLAALFTARRERRSQRDLAAAQCSRQ